MGINEKVRTILCNIDKVVLLIYMLIRKAKNKLIHYVQLRIAVFNANLIKVHLETLGLVPCYYTTQYQMIALDIFRIRLSMWKKKLLSSDCDMLLFVIVIDLSKNFFRFTKLDNIW